MLILDKPLGISINISLNSFMKGGKTAITTINIMNDINIKTINKDKNLGSFNPFWIWLHKLQTTLEITNEHIIKRRNSLNVHIIKRDINSTVNLK